MNPFSQTLGSYNFQTSIIAIVHGCNPFLNKTIFKK